MYNRYLKTIRSKISGMGVFANIKIPANVPIMEMTGKLYNVKNLPDNSSTLRIGPNLFIGPSGGSDDYINHSCNPNCYISVVGNRAILYSLYVIPIGSEITFDYSTTSTYSLNEWKMICNCGTTKCRKVISGLKYLDKNLIENYDKRGMIPLFMKNSMFK